MKKNYKFYIVILTIILLLIIITFAYIKLNSKNNLVSNNKCDSKSGYCIYRNNKKEYYVLNNSYTGDFNIEYFSINKEKKDELKEFSILTYEEYMNFCKKYNINAKYTDKDKNYIVYTYSQYRVSSINAQLGDVDYKDDKVILYIWDKENEINLHEKYDGLIKAYAIIIPTKNKVKDYKVIPLMHRTEYNKRFGLNILNGYYYNKEDNINLANKSHINSNNSKLNTILNNSIDALAKEHTIKVETTFSDSKDILTSNMDLINSVFKIEDNKDSFHYNAYTDDMKLVYSKNNNKEIYLYKDYYLNRRQMLYDVFLEYGNNIIENYNNIKIDENDNNYIISINKTNCYINKKNYLIDKITNENKTNTFSYVNDEVKLPDKMIERVERIEVKKPILYLYPEKETNIKIKLGNPEELIVSYPNYINEWNVTAYPDGNIYDKTTERNYYGLYWESQTKYSTNLNTGFVVRNNQLIEFFEEKLSILGLNDKEINEFIIYWLPILNNNKYNLIHFLTEDEINKIEPINFSVNPDTFIRVYMQVKPLKEKINVKEQKLVAKKRNGFVAVDWGGSLLD